MEENQHLEWKAKWRDEYIKWIYGFANAGGGRLEIRKNDEGVIVGIATAFFRAHPEEAVGAVSHPKTPKPQRP